MYLPRYQYGLIIEEKEKIPFELLIPQVVYHKPIVQLAPGFPAGARFFIQFWTKNSTTNDSSAI